MTPLESVCLQRIALIRDLRAAYDRGDWSAIENLVSALERANEQIAYAIVQSRRKFPNRHFRRWLHYTRNLYRRLRRAALARGERPLTYREFRDKFLG